MPIHHDESFVDNLKPNVAVLFAAQGRRAMKKR